MSKKKNILFVDDEPNILQGLRRMLRVMKEEWDVSFANSGLEALKILTTKEFDIIVSDIRMPEMDGVELLKKVREHFPKVIRIALTGEMGDRLGFKAARVVNQCLFKPISIEQLRDAIDRASSLQENLANDAIKECVVKMEHLPSLPDLYEEIKRAVDCSQASMGDVADIISKDLAMTAKILQLANSAFFGISSRIDSIKQAITMLGLELIADLILTVHLFSSYDDKMCPGFSISKLWGRSLEVASLAHTIAKSEKQSQDVIDGSFLTGILVDIGKLILAVNFPDKYKEVIEKTNSDPSYDCRAEQELFSTTHAEVGGYLGSVWAFPHYVIEGVTYHHSPRKLKSGNSFCPLSAVHIADSLVYKSEFGKDDRLDTLYLQQLGLGGKLRGWEKQMAAMGEKCS